jgi:glycosyltransferase involved in cell wall biosynthesis
LNNARPARSDGPIVLLIPAYRPTQALVDLIVQVLALDSRGLIFEQVVVVNDGSGSAFETIFTQFGELDRVTLLNHAINLGKGAALRTGFNYVFAHWPGTPGCVTADADGQHLPADIISVGEALIASPASFVLGVRRFDGDVPFRSLLGNFVTKQIFRLLTGKLLADTQTGLRGWPRKYCLDSLHVPLNGYDFELACLVSATQGDVRQVPITTVYFAGNRSSHFSPLRDSMRIYFVFFRYSGAALSVALIDSIFFYWMYSTSGNLLWAQGAGRGAAAIAAFLLARNFVFRSDTSVSVALAKYLTLVITMGLLCYHLIRILHFGFGVPIVAAKVLSEGLLFLGNFAIQRDFIFVNRMERE